RAPRPGDPSHPRPARLAVAARPRPDPAVACTPQDRVRDGPTRGRDRAHDTRRRAASTSGTTSAGPSSDAEPPLVFGPPNVLFGELLVDTALEGVPRFPRGHERVSRTEVWVIHDVVQALTIDHELHSLMEWDARLGRRVVENLPENELCPWALGELE